MIVNTGELKLLERLIKAAEKSRLNQGIYMSDTQLYVKVNESDVEKIKDRIEQLKGHQ